MGYEALAEIVPAAASNLQSEGLVVLSPGQRPGDGIPIDQWRPCVSAFQAECSGIRSTQGVALG
ncbi:hypothetical protein FRUB_06661 [Fimbriiglobus ruber]|uniref:Uncharacterized protein n=1 Tax=Fimbriiglobus ruber TaxID=1908690 RepID=A0A225D7K2_9BACT|nr:hypothetical protein FRUB_06661 [Fimbriiglobus ruber]